jgi:hypothetical protein
VRSAPFRKLSEQAHVLANRGGVAAAIPSNRCTHTSPPCISAHALQTLHARLPSAAELACAWHQLSCLMPQISRSPSCPVAAVSEAT